MHLITIIYMGDGMLQIMSIIFRTVFFYFFIIFLYRIMGKREVGELGIIDLIVSILMAELVAISIENLGQSLWLTILPLLVLGLLEVLLAFISTKSRRFRLFMDGKPSLIVCRGKINYHEMIKQRYSMDDLLLSLRINGIKNISEVEYAFLENNGVLSIFKYNSSKEKYNYPMPLILDGVIDKESLNNINKSNDWLKNELVKKRILLNDVFYAFYKNQKIYIIKKDELNF